MKIGVNVCKNDITITRGDKTLASIADANGVGKSTLSSWLMYYRKNNKIIDRKSSDSNKLSQSDKCQLIIAGSMDLSCSCPSHEKFAEGYLLEEKYVIWHYEQYLPETADPKDPKNSPLFEPNLAGLPEAVVITAECDPLVDENEVYAKKLALP